MTGSLLTCPKCNRTSGDDWRQCNGVCPMPGSPHYSSDPSDIDGPADPFPQPQRKDGGEPCGECHIQPGETCDICGAVGPASEAGDLIDRTLMAWLDTNWPKKGEAGDTMGDKCVVERKRAEAAARLAALQQERDEAVDNWNSLLAQYENLVHETAPLIIARAEASEALASSLQNENALQAEEIADVQDRYVSAASETASLQRRVEELTGVLTEATIKVENDRTLWNAEWQQWLLTARAALTPPEQGGKP